MWRCGDVEFLTCGDVDYWRCEDVEICICGDV